MEEISSTFQGSSQSSGQFNQFPPSFGDSERPVLFANSNTNSNLNLNSNKEFYASVGTVDETNPNSNPNPNPNPNSNSNLIPINNFPTLPSKSSFSSLIPSLIDMEASLKSVVLENESRETSAIRSAWIPSERTSGALHAIASSVPPSDFMGADQLTKPGIMSDKLFVNPAFDFAMRFVGTIPPSMILTPDEMLKKNDIRGLLQNGFFSSAANVSAKLLYAFEQGFGRAGHVTKHNSQSLILWNYRIAALTMLDQIELAAKELEAFGDLDNPDLYFEYYNQSSDEKLFGSMIPFSLRLLHARIPQRLGSPKITLDRLFSIKDKIELMLKNATDGILPVGITSENQQEFIQIWQNRRITTFYHIIAAAIQCEDFDTAINLLRNLLKLCSKSEQKEQTEHQNEQKEREKEQKNERKEHQMEQKKEQKERENEQKIWHFLGLVYCHIGTPRTAKICFDACEKVTSEENLVSVCLLHRAILTVCEASPAQALEIYAEILTKFPENSSAANGVAVGHFYAGRMSEAMIFLENLVFGNPKIFLTEQSVRNLTAMYELQNIQVRERKLKLLSLICQFVPDGRGVNDLKLLEI